MDKFINIIENLNNKVYTDCIGYYEEFLRLNKLLEFINNDNKINLEEKNRQIKQIKQILNNKYKNNKNNKNCISRSKVPLRNYQIKTVKYIINPNNNSLLVVHGTGTGKTLSALTASQCYLDEYPDNKVVVISPKSVIDNFYKEMKLYGGNIDNRYNFFTFEKFSRNLIDKIDMNYDCNKTMLIIDEAHNIRNQTKKYDAIYKCAIQSDKILLLTATPFVNKLHDFVALINILYRDDNILHKKNIKIPKIIKSMIIFQNTLKNIEYMLKNKVSFINDKKSDDFPKVNMYKINIPMSMDVYAKYIVSLIHKNIYGSDPSVFYHGYRRAVNDINDNDVEKIVTNIENISESEQKEIINKKMKYVIEIINDGKQSIIFTNWLSYGVDIIKENLNNNNTSWGLISGNTTNRSSVINDYNSKLFQVLIITKAGSEGIDVKETRNVIILDPVWHPAALDQIIGRAVRFKSHDKLSVNERYVNVYMLIMTSPDISKNNKLLKDEILNVIKNDIELKDIFVSIDYDLPMSGDELLYKISDDKNIFRKNVENMLENISI